MDTTLQNLQKATTRLMLKAPFYSHLFSTIIKEITRDVPTMAIGVYDKQFIKLYINPDFFETVLTTDDLKQGVITHEMLHLVFQHIFIDTQPYNPTIFNIAADIVVNQFIPKEYLPDAVTLETFPKLQLKSNQTILYYYEQLNKLWQGISLNSPTTEGHPKDNSSSKRKKGSNAKNNATKSKQNSQTNVRSSKGGQQESNANSPSVETLKKLMSQNHPHLQKHDSWAQEINTLTEAEKRNLKAMTEQTIQKAIARGTENIGSLPLGIREALKQLTHPLKPTVDWRRMLRIFAQSGKKTYIKNTIRRPSRRYGTSPGIKVKNRHKLLVAIDTSGSIRQEELNLFFAELHHIWKLGAEILVVECDVTIHKQYLYKGRTPLQINGSGGTSFEAPLLFANNTYHPDAIIYFTDGFGHKPQTVSRSPVLWLLTPEGMELNSQTKSTLPGRVVKIVL